MSFDPHADAVALGDWEHARPEGGLWWGGAFVAAPVAPPPEPKPGEIWQDAEGTLMCASSTGRWWVFGRADTVDSGESKVVHPLSLVFNRQGEFVGERLSYPASLLDGEAAPKPRGRTT